MLLVVGSPLSDIRCSTRFLLFTVCRVCQWLVFDSASVPTQDSPPPLDSALQIPLDLPGAAGRGWAARGARGSSGAGRKEDTLLPPCFRFARCRFRFAGGSAEFGAHSSFTWCGRFCPQLFKQVAVSPAWTPRASRSSWRGSLWPPRGLRSMAILGVSGSLMQWLADCSLRAVRLLVFSCTWEPRISFVRLNGGGGGSGGKQLLWNIWNSGFACHK